MPAREYTASTTAVNNWGVYPNAGTGIIINSGSGTDITGSANIVFGGGTTGDNITISGVGDWVTTTPFSYADGPLKTGWLFNKEVLPQAELFDEYDIWRE